MDDKTFELLEKMYGEILEIKQDVKSNAKAIANNAKAIAKIKIIIEDQIDKKLDALFDGYKQNSERITRLEEKVDKLIDKVEKQEVEIKVIKAGC